MSNEPAPARQLPLVSAELVMVGKYIVLWNLVENEFDTILLEITSLGYQAIESITKNPNVPAKMDIFVALVKSFLKDDRALVKDAENCASSLKKMSNFRNKVAHGRWLLSRIQVDPEHRPLIAISIRPGSEDHVTLGDLHQEYSKLCQLSRRIADVTYRCERRRIPEHRPLPSPWHGKF